MPTFLSTSLFFPRLPLRTLLAPHDATKPKMTCRCVDRFGVARGGTIAAAIVRRAQMRAAFDHLARDFDVGQPGVETCFLRSAPRIFRDAACFLRVSLMFC